MKRLVYNNDAEETPTGVETFHTNVEDEGIDTIPTNLGDIPENQPSLAQPEGADETKLETDVEFTQETLIYQESPTHNSESKEEDTTLPELAWPGSTFPYSTPDDNACDEM